MLTVAVAANLCRRASRRGDRRERLHGAPREQSHAVLLSWTASSFRDTTDAAGRFVFSAIPAGEYSVSVERPGFAKLEVGQYGLSGTQLRDRDHLSGIVLKIRPEALIAGIVVGSDGKPLPCPLRLWKPTVYGGRTISCSLCGVRRRSARTPMARSLSGGLDAGRYFSGCRARSRRSPRRNAAPRPEHDLLSGHHRHGTR